MKNLINFTWVCTCEACPEQYDVYLNEGPAVAYVRLRWGELSVNPYVNGQIDWNNEIYYHEFDDGWMGCFYDEEGRNKYQKEIEKAIIKNLL